MVILAVVCCNFITSNICTYLPHCSHECNNLKSDATGSLRASASIGLSFFPYPSPCRRLPQSPGSVMLRRRRLSQYPLPQQPPLRHQLRPLSHRQQLFLRSHNDRQPSQRLLQVLTHHPIPPTTPLIRDLEPRTLPMAPTCMEECQGTAVSEVTG